jgi:hypothetical protein
MIHCPSLIGIFSSLAELTEVEGKAVLQLQLSQVF